MSYLDSVGRLILYAVCVGVVIRALNWLCARIWHITIDGRQLGALAGALIAFWIFWGSRKEPRAVAFATGLILVAYFLIKLVLHFLPHDSGDSGGS